MTNLMSHHVEHIPSYMDLIFISRFLERISDRTTNIGEDTVYAISAQETRHIHHVDPVRMDRLKKGLRWQVNQRQR